METKKKIKWGYAALAMGGVVAILLAFKPPRFLVTSILWAFGLLATTATPGILLGVWWKEANKLALIISSILCGVIYIIISPHVLPSISLGGTGLVAQLGMSGGMVTVPLSFALFIICSIIFNRVPALADWAPSMEDKMVVDKIHGWGDYDEKRYNGIGWPLLIVVVCVAVFFWGLVPWS